MTKKDLPEVTLEDALSSGEPIQSREITVEGRKPFTIRYRAMSWLDKSACVARATEFFMNENDQPQTMFHIDVYFREALKRILVELPWPISDKILNQLTPEIGEQLQAIIPSPLGESDANLVSGSEKPSKGARKTRSSTAAQ